MNHYQLVPKPKAAEILGYKSLTPIRRMVREGLLDEVDEKITMESIGRYRDSCVQNGRMRANDLSAQKTRAHTGGRRVSMKGGVDDAESD